MTDSTLIEFHNATVFRGSTRVFDNLNLRIDSGEPTVILGPNGAGKTTLLKVINRELYPARTDDSWVRILGKERWNVWELRSRIGIVSHDLQMRYRTSTTGLDVVLSGFHSSIGVHGHLATQISVEQKEKADHILDELGVGQLGNTALKKMSTGQQRRCLLARALVHEPRTLILDEPTAGLDLAASFDYLERIRELRSDGKNIVVVTHLLNEIPHEIDRIVLLRDGKVIADGPKKAVLTEELLTSAYGTRIKLAEIDGYYLAYPPNR